MTYEKYVCEYCEEKTYNAEWVLQYDLFGHAKHIMICDSCLMTIQDEEPQP